jgi:hypothetical protein
MLKDRFGLELLDRIFPPTRPIAEDVLSLSRLQQGLKEVLRLKHDKCGTLEFRTDDRTPCFVRRPDGSIKRTQEDIDLSAEQIKADLLRGYRQRLPMYQFEGYSEMDPGLKEGFIAFVDLLQSFGTEVILFLPPYHPFYEELYRGTGWHMVLQSDAFVKSLAAQRSIRMVGSYSGREAGCTSEDFFDGFHARPSCLIKALVR